MAARACAIIHVGANSAVMAVNSSEIALCLTGIVLFAGIMSTANSGLPLWEMYFH